MKKIFLLLSIVAIITTTACSEDEVPMFGGVYGIVSDAETGEPIRNASIVLSPSNLTTVTGSDGHYEFSDLTAASYKVQCSANGYNTNSRQVTVYAGGSATCDFLMTKQQSVSGISLSTNALDFGKNTSEELFSITNTGNSGTISWSISNISVTWLTVTPISGSVAQGKSCNVTVSIDRSKITKDEDTYITINAAGGSMSVAVYVVYDDGSGNGDNGSGEQGESKINFNTATLDFGTSDNELILEIINMPEATANLRWEIDSYPDCISIPFTSGELEPGYYHELKITLNRSAMTSDLNDSIIIRDLDDNEYYYRIIVTATNVVEESYSSASVTTCDSRVKAEIVSCKRTGSTVVFTYRLMNIGLGTVDSWRIYPTNSLSLINGGYRSTVFDNLGNEYFYSLFTFRNSSSKENVIGTAFPEDTPCTGTVTVYNVPDNASTLTIMLGVFAYPDQSYNLADKRIYFKNIPIY